MQLEGANLLLETEYLTRSNQLQLAAWNRVDFGYTAPNAAQFLDSVNVPPPLPTLNPAPAASKGSTAGTIPMSSRVPSPQSTVIRAGG